MITNLMQYLDKQYETNKGKTALRYESEQLTFGELYSFVKHISARIQKTSGDRINRPVIVFCDKSIIAYSALLGVLYSGNYYVPLDTKMPAGRLQIIIELLDADIAVTSSDRAAKLDDIGFKGEKIIIDTVCPAGEQGDVPKLYSRIIDTDPAYVLFTSGSTGIPKGVIISHRAVIDYIEWQCSELDFDETTVLANQAPFYFDASMPDIFTPLAVGSALILIPERLFLIPGKLIDYLNRMDVNTLIWVPSALVTMTARDYFSKARIHNLRLVMFCGEVMPTKHLNIWRRYYPGACFVNLYGPTEAAYACTYYKVDREFEDSQPLPIGRACKNTEILLLDENGQVVTNGVGEICIRGSCLANGYYRDPERTEAAFLTNSSNCCYREIIYCTGDLARYNDRGELEYIGRKDFQIKHQGYRIELGEIEAAANGMPEIEQCCAVYNSDKQRIALYCVSEGAPSEKEIYQFLKRKLPGYMLPKEILLLKSLPLNANGKIDRLLLRNRYIGQHDS